ncbi:hypothetical protein BOTBODRAFT_27758 [Botryobasidium botryosum FD-172 SS1]|uniref:F-box domain-containing protein n=1 Tax=Botryobasidium botryosum (strain FD-172 SS1) TaxID=930990 RepID=A0A067N9B8_BOTB1|nr:hypothetical protein BOTBODRAFT_27758 [Botryobasidium botryosum FD-172 SS1]
MLSTLPPEVILQILSHLPVYSLPLLRALSSSWKDFLDLHESTIYRSAAFLHAIASPGSSLEDSKGTHVLPWLDDVNDWKSFCRKHVGLEKAWTGKAVATKRSIDLAIANDVHRVKIDEEQRTVICTNRHGGLQVMCALQSTLLWSLPPIYVVPYSHLEYSHGFIVFNRHGRDLEVWQRETDRGTPDLIPRPDAAQLMFQEGVSLDQPAARGRYRPFAVLTNPTATRAYRLVYPHLLVASQFAQEAYIWHIPTSSLIQTLAITTPEHFYAVDYVEISNDHAFFCSAGGLFVYSRQTGTVVFEVPSQGSSLFDGALSRVWELGFQSSPDLSTRGSSIIILESHSLVPLPKEYVFRAMNTGFATVHVSPCGRDLVAVSRRGLMIYVRDFTEPRDPKCPAHALYLGSGVVYMAYDGSRIAVCTAEGLYCITLDSSHSAAVPLLPRNVRTHSFPSSSVQTLELLDVSALGEVTCLQLTPTSLWLTGGQPTNPTRDICYVDFTQSQ